MQTICIYHGNCADGFGAAWVVNHKLNGVDFHAGVYGEDPPDVKNKNVIMVDFSYKRSTLNKMIDDCAFMLILDHHESAMKDLEGVFDSSKVTGEFDMDRSGAMMTWNHFFPDTPAPNLIRHIQDQDLWRFELSFTREIQAAVFSYPYDFEVWDDLNNSFDMAGSTKLIEEGLAIDRRHQKDIKELLKVTRTRMNISGYNVPVANLPYTMASDAAGTMAEGEPFAACYWYTPRGQVFSLRSTDGGVNVSDIAVKYGGGGHAKAAGFTLKGERDANNLEICQRNKAHRGVR